MKKIWMKALCMILGMTLLLSACGKTAPEESAEAKTENPAVSAEEQPDKWINGKPGRKNMVKPLRSEKRTMKNPWGEDIVYEFYIPKLVSDKPGAQLINDEIENAFGQIRPLDSLEEGEYPLYRFVKWKAYWNGDLLSLVIRSQQEYDLMEYRVYNYDYKKDKRLNDEELLERIGCDQKTFVEALRIEAAKTFDRSNHQIPEEYIGGLPEMRIWTLAERNVDPYLQMNSVGGQIYLSSRNRLAVVTPIGTLAGAGVYKEVLYPELNPRYAKEKTVKLDFITAHMEEGKVTISFEPTENSDSYLAGSWAQYKVPYEVKGLYGRCQNIHLGSIGTGFSPYLFITDEQGYVHICNILAGAPYEFFSAAGPIPQLENIEYFENEIRPGYEAVVAIDEDDERFDMERPIMVLEKLLPESLADCSWITEDEKYTMILQRGAYMNYYPVSERSGKEIGGAMIYLGMDDSGIFYQYSLSEVKNGIPGPIVYNGIMKFDYTYDKLNLSILGGSDLFGITWNQTVSLSRTYG